MDAEERPRRNDSWSSGGQSGPQAHVVRLGLRSSQWLAFGVQVSLDEPEQLIRLARDLDE
jgi:hypothetical protein